MFLQYLCASPGGDICQMYTFVWADGTFFSLFCKLLSECARASACVRACEFISHVPSKIKVFRNLKRNVRNSFQFGGRAPASLFHLLYYLNLICGRGGTRSKQWAADGSGPGCWSRVGGAPSGFTFCVRAAEQVKELGYAHNLRVVLRKWPKIWSCDAGDLLAFLRPERRHKIRAEFWLKPVDVLRAPPPLSAVRPKDPPRR